MVVDNSELSRFELRVGEDLAIADYRKDGGTITFTHTKVPDHLEGRGMGSELAKAGLESARRRNLKVVPSCPFIASYIEKNPEYQDLLGLAGMTEVAEEEVRYYSTPEMTVEWRASRCIHSGNCVRGLPGVFAPKKRPWITIGSTSADSMEEAILRCPSGALKFVRHDPPGATVPSTPSASG